MEPPVYELPSPPLTGILPYRLRKYDAAPFQQTAADYFASIRKRVGPKQVNTWAQRYANYVGRRLDYTADTGRRTKPLQFGRFFREQTKPESNWFSKTFLGKTLTGAVALSPVAPFAFAADRAGGGNTITSKGLGSVYKQVEKSAKGFKKNPAGLFAAAAGVAAGNPLAAIAPFLPVPEAPDYPVDDGAGYFPPVFDQAPSPEFDWTPVLIGGAVLAAIFILRK